jgi:hypothetical protein
MCLLFPQNIRVKVKTWYRWFVQATTVAVLRLRTVYLQLIEEFSRLLVVSLLKHLVGETDPVHYVVNSISQQCTYIYSNSF